MTFELPGQQLGYPKWKYRVDPATGAFQSTLVLNEKAEQELGASWADRADVHGVDVVPYPAEISPTGALLHHASRPDANGNHAYGPRPSVPGINGSIVR